MKPVSILETILYADSIDKAVWFYHEVLGFEKPGGQSKLMTAFRIDEHHVLLIFNPTMSDLPGREVPSHGARGAGHIAFRIKPETYQSWLDRFASHDIAIEQEIQWERDYPAKSIYVRDPSGNSVELITADIWK